MKFTRLKGILIAAGVAAMALIGSTPATAGTVTTLDPSGVDFDAACLVGNPSAPPSTPNNVPSPGTNSACLIGTYDGSTEGTDLYELTMDSIPVTGRAANVQLAAEFALQGVAPLPGSTCNPQVNPGCFDLPDRTFVGAGYKALFQVPARQNNTPTNNVGGGCPRIPTGQVFDQHEHWLDGYHFFIGLDVVWDGSKWVWSAQIGEYDPAPDGAFFFTELGVNGGLGWQSSDPNAQFGVHWSVTATVPAPNLLVFRVLVDGTLGSADATNCANGVFNTVYARAGDSIINIKGLTTADSTVTLPVTIPLSLIPGQSDITSVGGFIFYSDITHGNSQNQGLVGGTLETLGLGIRENVSYTGGFLGISDTLGDSPACPTPTFGGTLPPNPFLNTSVGCQYDDHNIPVPNLGNPAGPWTAIDPGERGTFLSEWWHTPLSFIA